MRKMLIAGLVAAAQILPAAQPAAAAELHEDRTAGASQVSAFAGARLRVPIGGRERPRAGLALTSTLRSGPTGELRFAKGAELGFSRDRNLQVFVGGVPVSQLAQGRETPKGRKAGVSTTGWIAIGVGVVALAGAAYVAWLVHENNEPHD